MQSYKARTVKGIQGVTFTIIVGHDCTPENPAVLFTWREADSDAMTLLDTLPTISSLYDKLIRINLSNNTYLQRRFAEDPTPVSFRYRRKVDDEFRWVQLEIAPSVEYSEENQVMLLSLRDVHEEYTAQLRSRQELVDTMNRDALTNLFNRLKFNQDIENLKSRSIKLSKRAVELAVDEVRRELLRDNYEILVGIETETVQFAYQKTNDIWMNVRILEVDRQQDARPETIWIFAEETR